MTTPADALDRMIAIHEAAFADQPPQQETLRVYVSVHRSDLAALKELRRAMDQATEGR